MSKTIIEKLIGIQQELKAPKGQFNDFGNFKYRSCEDILEAAKPVLAKHNCAITLSDQVLEIGGRIFVHATATLRDTEGGEISTTALAREAETKKGMDPPQMTGTASSYARKYCLSGMFCLDDTKDADTNEYKAQQQKEPEKSFQKESSPEESYRDKIKKYVQENGLDMNAFAAEYKLSQNTTEEQFKALYQALTK